MLTLVMKPLFTRHIGPLMAEPHPYRPRRPVLSGLCRGLVWLVSLPALRTGAPVFLPALVLGAMAYGTYEFTSFAIMKDWHWSMVVTDTVWGACLTAVLGVGGRRVWRGLWRLRRRGTFRGPPPGV